MFLRLWSALQGMAEYGAASGSAASGTGTTTAIPRNFEGGLIPWVNAHQTEVLIAAAGIVLIGMFRFVYRR